MRFAKDPEQPPKEKTARRGKRILLNVLLGASLTVFLVSAGVLVYQLVIAPAQNRSKLNKYQELYQTGASSSSSPAAPTSSAGTVSEPDGYQAGQYENVLDKFRPLLSANPDTAGWLTIDGTDLNQPVFYTPQDQNHYLTLDPDGSYNKYGSLFLSAGSTLNPQAQAMTIYGHNMEQDDLMFGQLNKFKQLSFLREHPTFTFDTIYAEGTWKILAVCRLSTAELGRFNYATSEFADEAAFDTYIKQARIRSMYHINDDVSVSDSLVVLSTCDYYFYGDRLVVIARKLRAGETADSVRTDAYEQNPVMLWPDVYYTLSYATSTRASDEAIEQAYLAYYGE